MGLKRFYFGQGFVLTLLALFCTAMMAVFPVPALAQDTTQGANLAIENATLRLWPEYDDPGLLVILDGSFSSGFSSQTQVTFPVPANAHGIQTTEKDQTGALLSQPWERAGDKITYSLPSPGFQVEYYVDRSPSGDQRDLSYTFEAPYAIKQLEIDVQQPARSTGFSMTPQPDGSTPGGDGLTYYHMSRSNVAAGDRIALTIRYVKTDQSPSTSPAVVPTVAVNAPAPASTRPSSPVLAWLLIGVGSLSLLAAAAYWFLQIRRPAAPVRRGRQPNGAPKAATYPERRIVASGAGAESSAETAFCPRCGHRFGPEDQFCAKCGAPRRR